MKITKIDPLCTPEILEKSKNLLFQNIPEIFFPNPRVARRVLTKNPPKNNIGEYLSSILSQNPSFSICDEEDALLVGILEPMKFESSIFKKNMFSLKLHENKRKNLSSSEKNEFVAEILDFSRKHGIDHISCKLLAEKIDLAQSLETSGFLITSNLITYLFVLGATRLPNWRPRYPVRRALPDEKEKILELAWKSFRGTRFYNDPTLNNDQCDELYLEWVRNCFDSGWASAIFVAENSKKDIVGFFTYLIDPRTKEFFGIVKGGGGISACSPEAKGAYFSLLESSIKDVPKVNGFLGEFTTQSENNEVIRIFQKFGLEFGKSEFVFHKGLK